MGDIAGVSPGVEEADAEEERIISAVRVIVEALGTKKHFSDGAQKILAELSSRLSIHFAGDNRERGLGGADEAEEMLNSMQEKLANFEASQIMISDLDTDEFSVFLKNVRQLQKSMDSFENENPQLLDRAYDVLHASMEWLEEEFIHIIFQNKQPFETENVSFRSNEDDVRDEGSVISFEEDAMEDFSQRTSMHRSSEELIIDLIKPDALPQLRTIADLMYRSNYGHECSQAFIFARKEAIDECLSILEVEKLSIEEVLKMNWRGLSSKIRRWVRAMKIVVRVYLASEKKLANQVFEETNTMDASNSVFIEVSKSSMLQLMNFVEAVTISAYKPEKLLGILDMYEVLVDLLPDIEVLYPEDSISCITSDCHEVLHNLGNSVKATVLEFENAIAKSTSTHPFAGGGIHHLTRYVMNYATILTDYSDTLNFLLDFPLLDGDGNPRSPISVHLQHLISLLESNLEAKASLYTNVALQELFLMNNVYYIAQKVKSSDLRGVLGDEWIRRRNWKFQQHAMNYERASWSSILAVLKDDGVQNRGSGSTRNLLRERLQEFYVAFEDAYKTQTSWMIQDVQLREDLRISTSLKVVQAYRSFVGRNSNHIGEKYIKYNADDLQSYILDLFEGSQKSLQSFHRRG